MTQQRLRKTPKRALKDKKIASFGVYEVAIYNIFLYICLTQLDEPNN